MRKLPFGIEKCIVSGSADSAYLDDGDDLTDALVAEVIRNVGTDLEVEVGGVTMFLAAWQDPEHWATDWAEKLGVEHEDVPGTVAALLANAVEVG